MKKTKFITPAALMLAATLTFQSCIGSFSLTNKVLTWNRQVSNKFVNELVFFAFWVLPVYEVTAAADLLVINSIEFWSGNKPLEADNKIIDTENGRYLIAADNTGYKITSPNGDTIDFEFNSESGMWSFSKNGSDKIDFLQFTDEENVRILNKHGEFVDVELSHEGLNNYIFDNLPYLMAMK